MIDEKKLIRRLEEIKSTCGTLQEQFFFDGVIAIVETQPKCENITLKWEDLEVYTPYFNNTTKKWCYFSSLHNETKTGVMITIDTVPTMSAFAFDMYEFSDGRMMKDRIAKDWIDVLPELVDKATPKKPKGISITHDGRVGNCPNCNKLVRECDYKADICECGQALDWSDEDE